jgi:hypothetical protein
VAHEPALPSEQEAPVDVTGTSCGRDVYLVAVNAKDRGALASLFAPDVVALNPFGEFVGHDAVLGPLRPVRLGE